MILALHSSALLAVSVLSVLAWPRLWSLSCDSPLYRWLVVVLLCASWAFAALASLLSSLPPDPNICSGAIFLCAGLYGAAKFCVYLFLMERLHLIATKGPRHKSPVYLVSCLLLIPFFVIVVLLMIYRVGNLNADGCQIGIRREGAIPLVVYDTAFGLYQMALFASIMFRYITRTAPNHDAQTALLRKALKVAFIGSSVAFMLSFFNILTFVIKEDLHSDICLVLCIIDVVGNCCVITYLVRPISSPTGLSSAGRFVGKNVSLVAGELGSKATRVSTEKDFENELQTVAEMLKQMQAQGRQRDPTTSSAIPEEVPPNADSRLLDVS